MKNMKKRLAFAILAFALLLPQGGGAQWARNAVQAPATENVTWTNGIGVSINGSNLTKAIPGGSWDAGAVSTRAIASGNGYVEFSASPVLAKLMAGLSHGDANVSYDDIDYAVFFLDDGYAYAYESGEWKGVLGPYSASDRFQVAIEGTTVRYRKNGDVLYESPFTSTYPLLLDTSLNSANATVQGAVLFGTLTDVE